jgi:2'-5' RNA ligase
MRRTEGGSAWGSIRSVIVCTAAFLSTVRLFVAVWPPTDVVARLASLPRPAVRGVRWTTPDQWHVTLRFLGEADPHEWTVALRSVRWGPPPEAVVAADSVRLGRDVLCLPVAGLDGSAAAVDPTPERPFKGHLTLARRRHGRLPVGVTLGDPARWPVTEVTLVASRLRSTGAEYEVLERTPVR